MLLFAFLVTLLASTAVARRPHLRAVSRPPVGSPVFPLAPIDLAAALDTRMPKPEPVRLNKEQRFQRGFPSSSLYISQSLAARRA